MADLIYTADYSELTGMIKTIDQTKRAVQLLGNTLANTKDSSSYMRGINQIVEAQKKLAPSARMSRSEIMKLGAAMKQEAEFAKALAAATTQADAATGSLGKKMSRTGVVFQQAGYQIGDFAVQVQSGTHYMVALGQQLTQLVGVGAMLARSTAWIAAFSALGVIVPIATAVAGAFMRIKKESEGLKDAEENVKSLTKAVEEWKIAKAALDLGVSSDVYRGMKAFEVAVENTRETLRTLRQDLLESGEESVMKVVAQDLLASLGIGGGSLEAQAQAALDKYNELGELLKSLRQIELEKKDQFVQKLDRELQLQQEIKRFGEDSLQVADLKLKFEKEDLAAQARKLGFSEAEIAILVDKLSLTEETRKQIEAAERAQKALLEDTSAAGDEMVKAFNAAKDLREEIGEGAVKALELAGVDITSGVDAAAKAAARLADNLNVSLGHAINIMNLNEEVKGRMVRRGVREGTIPPQALADLPQTESERAYEQLMAARRRAAELRERESSRSGGGGAAAGDRIGALAQSLATEKEMLEQWYQDSLVQLSEFNSKELELLGGHAEAKERLEQEHQDRLAAIEQAAQQRKLSETAGLFGALASIASAGGKKMAKVAATFGAIEATINAYKGATAALADPNISVAGRLAAYASVLAAGLQGVAAIRQAGGIGGGSGGSGGGGVIATPTAAAASPQRVIIEGIGPNDLITGSQLSEIFDRLYEENENRGLVFQIAS